MTENKHYSLTPYSFSLKQKNIAGFTLVEIVVALALFALVAVVAIGSMVRVVDANRKAQTLKLAVNNINFTLESISRELRVGATYHCRQSASDLNGLGESLTIQPQACLIGTGAQLIAFKSSKSDPGNSLCRLIYVYRFRPDNVTTPKRWYIEKAEQSTCNAPITDPDFQSMISKDVVITDYRLGVSSEQYPLLFLRLIGSSGTREIQKTYVDVQTTVSQRILD